MAAAQFGVPRLAITDRGSQFRAVFADLLRTLGVDVIHGPVERPQFNGKCERFFSTLKLWQRIARWEKRAGETLDQNTSIKTGNT
jgi:transposase InsO family protein